MTYIGVMARSGRALFVGQVDALTMPCAGVVQDDATLKLDIKPA